MILLKELQSKIVNSGNILKNHFKQCSEQPVQIRYLSAAFSKILMCHFGF